MATMEGEVVRACLSARLLVRRIPVSEKSTPFRLASAVTNSSGNSYPAPDRRLFMLKFQRVLFSGGVFLRDTGRTSRLQTLQLQPLIVSNLW